VGYIERKGKSLHPLPKGMKLIDIVPPELKSPETTGKWEKGLASIQKGTMDEEKFMGSIQRYVKYLVEYNY
jgi:DNA topoisomerase-3